MNTEELSKIAEAIQHQEQKQLKRFSWYTMVMLLIAISIGSWSVYEGVKATRLQNQVQQNEKKIDSLENRIQKAGTRLTYMQEKLVNNYEINSHIKIGLDNFYSNRFDLAIRAYEEGIKLDSSNYVLYDFSGYAYYKMKNYPMAIKLLKKSVELNPYYGWGYYNLGLVYWISGDKQSARETLKKLINTDKSFAKIMKNDHQFIEILKDKAIRELVE